MTDNIIFQILGKFKNIFTVMGKSFGIYTSDAIVIDARASVRSDLDDMQ